MAFAEPSHSWPAAAPKARGVCAIMRAETKTGQDDAFESIIGDLAHMVRNDEPGCDSYVVTRALGSRAHFAVHARFSDWSAFEGHADTEHMQRLMPRLSALLAAPISMEIFFEV